jgi:hypothetical protein
MKVATLGNNGLLAQATRAALQQRGHELGADDGDCAIFLFPGPPDQLRQAIAQRNYCRLILCSHAYAYGSNAKNPGMMGKDRISMLPAGPSERLWLELETIATSHPNIAIVRLTNLLVPEGGDLLGRKLSGRTATALSGYDPSVQFLSLEDAADILSAACEGSATGLFNAADDGAVPLKKDFATAGTKRVPIPL